MHVYKKNSARKFCLVSFGIYSTLKLKAMLFEYLRV